MMPVYKSENFRWKFEISPFVSRYAHDFSVEYLGMKKLSDVTIKLSGCRTPTASSEAAIAYVDELKPGQTVVLSFERRALLGDPLPMHNMRIDVQGVDATKRTEFSETAEWFGSTCVEYESSTSK